MTLRTVTLSSFYPSTLFTIDSSLISRSVSYSDSLSGFTTAIYRTLFQLSRAPLFLAVHTSISQSHIILSTLFLTYHHRRCCFLLHLSTSLPLLFSAPFFYLSSILSAFSCSEYTVPSASTISPSFCSVLMHSYLNLPFSA